MRGDFELVPHVDDPEVETHITQGSGTPIGFDTVYYGPEGHCRTMEIWNEAWRNWRGEIQELIEEGRDRIVVAPGFTPRGLQAASSSTNGARWATRFAKEGSSAWMPPWVPTEIVRSMRWSGMVTTPSKPLYQNWRRRIYAPAAHADGLEDAKPYTLRHSFVSLLIHEGQSVVAIAKQAGHSAEMCLRTYAHVFEELDPTDRRSAHERVCAARDVPVTYLRAEGPSGGNP